VAVLKLRLGIEDLAELNAAIDTIPITSAEAVGPTWVQYNEHNMHTSAKPTVC